MLPPEVSGPNVQPASVTVTVVLAASGVPETLKTMKEPPGTPGEKIAPCVDELAVGMAEPSKKPGG
jgi:hypothetical protein